VAAQETIGRRPTDPATTATERPGDDYGDDYGKAATVTVPPGTSSGARLRLRGRGVKNTEGARGDQFCRVEIVTPKIKADDAETRRLFEEIAKRAYTGPVRKF